MHAAMMDDKREQRATSKERTAKGAHLVQTSFNIALDPFSDAQKGIRGEGKKSL